MLRSTVIWGALLAAMGVPFLLAANSPLLAWRDPIYIAAGFAGIIGMAALLFQPLLAIGSLPGLTPQSGRRLHRSVGAMLLGAVVVHVVGLWITSPPDVIDALTFTSPTPFSAWGVIAMWAIFATAVLAMLRRRVPLRLWRLAHTCLALIIVTGSVVHAMLIEGTMEIVSKTILCALALGVTVKTVIGLRVFAKRR